MSRVLLTGGAGFIGSHVLEALLARGHEVTVLDDLNDFYAPRVKRENLHASLATGSATLLEGDVRDPAVWGRLGDSAGWHAVIHLAARAGVRPSLDDPYLYTSTNVGGTALALQWASEGAVPFVLASSSSVYGDGYPVPFGEEAAPLAPVSPYGASKEACEGLARTWQRMRGLPVVALRFFTVYGPRQRPDLAIHKFARSIAAGEEIPVFGDGTSARDYTHVSDITRGVLGAMDGLVEGRLAHFAYNLGSDRGVRLDAMIAAVERAVGRSARVARKPDQLGDVKRTWADLSRSRADLHYAPTVDFDEGLADFVAWMRRAER